jgi:GNAT superfamily N-acetyltransferase
VSPIEAHADTAVLATAADLDVLAELLAKAFHKDALTKWITPDDDRRAAVLPGFFRLYLEISLQYDGVYTNARRDAALLFLPPGAWHEVERGGVALAQRFAEILGEQEMEMMATISGLQAVHHPMGRPHYYVSFAGVDPENQRHGAMAVLADTLIARADAEGVAMYTEASSAGGTWAALRLGFQEVGVTIAIPGGPTLRPMWREPR